MKTLKLRLICRRMVTPTEKKKKDKEGKVQQTGEWYDENWPQAFTIPAHAYT